MPGGWSRIETDCLTVGLEPPPVAVACQVRNAAQGWTIRARVPSGTEAAITSWLQRVGAVDVARTGPGALRARFGGLPDSIDILARIGEVDRFEATPEGRVTLTTRPPRGALDAMLVTLDTRPYDRDAALTPRQEAVLLECVSAGYYAIPRKATLRGLAKRLGTSTTGLSLTLRRAEARIVAAYVGRKRPMAGDDAQEHMGTLSAAASVVARDVAALDPRATRRPRPVGDAV